MQSLKNNSQLGAYTLIRLIGRGGMGEVYEAHENKLQRQVALKVIAPMKPNEHNFEELIRRFMQEARTLARVNHPNVVTIYTIDRIGEVQFIAMEFVAGASLKELLHKITLTADQAAPLFEQMLEGLRSLHDNRILHRDLKPHNILVRSDGQIKILDFGIAKNTAEVSSNHTTVGLIVGTIPYMAPEVQAGIPASIRSDLWSLGAIFYECLVGQSLAEAFLESGQNKELPFAEDDLKRIPEEMRAIILRMCSPNPNTRYQNALSVIEDLQKFRRERSKTTPETFAPMMAQVEAIIQARSKVDVWRMPFAALKQAIVGPPKVDNPPDPFADNPPDLPIEVVPEGIQPRTVSTSHASLAVTSVGELPRRSSKRRRKSRRRNDNSGILFYGGIIALTAVATALILNHRGKPDVTPERSVAAASQNIPAPVIIEPAAPSYPMPASATPPAVALELVEPANMQIVWLEGSAIPTLRWSRLLNHGEYEIQIASDEKFTRTLVQEPISGTDYRPARVLPEGIYHWRLRSKQNSQNYIGPQRFMISLLNPVELSQPDAQHVFEASRGRSEIPVDFTWRCKPGVNRYRIQFSMTEDFKRVVQDQSVTACRFETTLNTGTVFWRVRMEEIPGAERLWSTSRMVSVRSAPLQAKSRGIELVEPKLKKSSESFVLKFSSPPRDLASLGRNLKQYPVLEWAPVKDAKNYLVQLSFSSTFAHLLSENSVTTNKFVWRSVQPGKIFWRVRAFNSSREASNFSQKGMLRVLLPAPSLNSVYKFPVTLTAEDPIALDWPPIALAERYVIEISPTRNLAGAESRVSKENKLLFAATPATYFIRVAAADSTGDPLSEFSRIAAVDLELSNSLLKPKLVSPSVGASAPSRGGKISIQFTWSPVNSADSYAIEISSDPDFTKIIEQRRVTESKVVLKQLELSGRVYWRVRAQSSQGISEWSEVSHFNVN